MYKINFENISGKTNTKIVEKVVLTKIDDTAKLKHC